MVHGLGGSSHNWTALMGLLDERLASRAPDLPGFGFSPPPHDGDYSIAGHARAVVALIEADGRGPVHLFGNSMGGAVATTVAATRPDLVRTLTLISPALPDFVPGRWRSQVVTLATPGLGPLLARQVAGREPPAPGARPHRPVLRRPLEPVARSGGPPPSATWSRGSGCRTPPDAMVRSTQGIARAFLERGPDSLWQLAARVTAPTLLVYGSKDRLVRAASSRRAGRTFRHSRVFVLPETGHVAQMEHPGLVARLVREHLDHAAVTSD